MLENAKQIGHYKILSALGAGGMGEVFLAEDLRLQRKIALKILPEAFAHDAGRMRRFVREAKAASALNHPNILTIYETGESEGTNYIASEYIAGETLTARLRQRSDPLGVKDTLAIVVQIASALEAAHSAGIIHRDIKPDNVMIRPDRFVKLLDFGIAKSIVNKSELIDADAATAINAETTPGMIIGTANYMSPEQARGKAVDARTDIFSFGLVLYEMLSGRRVFEGENAMDVISSLLQKEPVPLRQLTPEISPEIERIVGKTLRKDREQRYQTIKDLLIDLKEEQQELELQNKLERTAPSVEREAQTRILNAATDSSREDSQTASSAEYHFKAFKKNQRSAALAAVVLLLSLIAVYWYFSNQPIVTKPIESIAIMPFVNQSGTTDVEYLSDGMTETLISSLSQIPKLNVKARSSVFRYKGKETNAQTIGKELNVQAILNGTVIQRGSNLDLHIELVDAATENVLWSKDYKQPMANLVSLQSDTTRDVSSNLKIKLSGADEQKLAKKPAENTEAYQSYLKARFYSAKSTKEGLKISIEYLNKAIEIDPNYALAWAGLAKSYWDDSDIHAAPNDVMPRAKQAALRALAIDDTLAEAHTALGIVLTAYDWDWTAAEREFRRAIELNPNDPTAHVQFGLLLSLTGRVDEAIEELKRATQLDSLSSQYENFLGLVLYFGHRPDESLIYFRKALELDSGYWLARNYLGCALISLGKYNEAIIELERARQEDDNHFVLGSLGLAYALSGNKTKAIAAIEQLKLWSKDHYVSPHSIAIIYSGLKQNDQAFEWLDKGVEVRSEWLGWVKVDPRLDPLRADPRLQELLKKTGFPE